MTPPRERILNVPPIIVATVAILVVIHLLRGLLSPQQEAELLAQFAFVPGRFTYAFLHANWTHIGFNYLWFVAFGAAVARRFQAARFLMFALIAAAAGALAHFLTHMDDLQPVIGALAVVSATMAPDGRTALSGSDDNTLKQWDLT